MGKPIMVIGCDVSNSDKVVKALKEFQELSIVTDESSLAIEDTRKSLELIDRKVNLSNYEKPKSKYHK